MGYEGCGGPDKVHMSQHKDHSRYCKPSAEVHGDYVRPHEWRWSVQQRVHEQIEDVALSPRHYPYSDPFSGQRIVLIIHSDHAIGGGSVAETAPHKF